MYGHLVTTIKHWLNFSVHTIWASYRFSICKSRAWLLSIIQVQYSPLLFIYLLFLFAVYFVHSFSCQTDKLDLDFLSPPSLESVPNESIPNQAPTTTRLTFLQKPTQIQVLSEGIKERSNTTVYKNIAYVVWSESWLCLTWIKDSWPEL